MGGAQVCVGVSVFRRESKGRSREGEREEMKRLLEALVILLSAEISMPTSGDVIWAVKLTGGTSRARELADERGLELVGRVDPFPDVFEFRLPRSAMEARSVEDGIGKLDDPSVDGAVHDELMGHPAVQWVSRQVPLRRTKRDFADPAFPRQWHLV